MNAKYKVLKQAYEDHNKNIVDINYDVIMDLNFKDFTLEELSNNEQEALSGKNFKESVYFLLALNSINYQYWDLNNNEFYRYSNNNQVGALAAFDGFNNMWKDLESKDIFNKLNSEKAKETIIEYFGNIPEIDSRIKIFKESLDITKLEKAFKIIEQDINLHKIDTNTADAIAQIMPISFNEPYLKKIQLALYEITLHAKIIGFKVKEELTVAADYQLPKVLEAMGILTYSPELTDKITKQQPIAENSPEEKAIRGATIIACESIATEHNVSIPAIDRWLWLARNDFKNKKFHLTKTTAY